MSKFTFVLVAVVLAVSGCSKKTPCESLSASVCKDASAEECANIKRQVADADEEKQALCEQVSLVLPEAGKARNTCDELASMVCTERPLQDCLNMRKEAVGADANKIKVCEQFKGFILNTRKINAEKADAQRASIELKKGAEAVVAVPATQPAPAEAAPPVAAPTPAETH